MNQQPYNKFPNPPMNPSNPLQPPLQQPTPLFHPLAMPLQAGTQQTNTREDKKVVLDDMNNLILKLYSLIV